MFIALQCCRPEALNPSIFYFFDECGTDVNSPANDLSRPLHLASREGHTNAVQHLLERGAGDSLKDSHGRTGSVLFRDLFLFTALRQWFNKFA
ncbi:hypothetical protein DAPPUDRAFT_264716 [Daphnia pulex]|uniref:Uncharacterized protein n=1 Tax=Daphnia pulex TaxID=6669 RepID=E9HS56_DAPPU|nr:hypothetical protein DAPPUDRAFT_264716 [Daphnia pulex]|eukprot:EFX65427.1 hypothetical protein DAPPUDRAFT_264716 [Daphnia pulex]